MRSYIDLLDKQIPLYGLLFYLGIALSAVAAAFIAKKRKIALFDITSSAVYVMIGALIGSKLLFVLVSFQDIIRYDLSFVAIIKGGFVFYGGLLGGVLGLIIYAREYRESFFVYADIYAAVLPLGHALGRVGCFFAGCCYGVEYDSAFSVIYHESAGLTPLGVPLLPVQLIESGCLLLLFTVMLVLYKKYYAKTGFCSAAYAFSYGILRFVLEFFRGDKERGMFLLSTSQWISLLIVCFAVLTILIRGRKRRNEV